jgi:hypothetical protein
VKLENISFHTMAAKTCALIIAVCLISIIVEGKVHKRGCPMAGPRADCIRRVREHGYGKYL